MRNRHLIFFLTFIFLTACSVKSPIDYFEAKIYKLDVQQGNIITAEMLMGLKPGMTRAQVKYVLGTPLIQDSFHENRWDYIYKMIKGSDLAGFNSEITTSVPVNNPRYPNPAIMIRLDIVKEQLAA